jgi:hypothetical protein
VVRFLNLHRLRPAGQVDDGKAAVPETDMPINKHASCIWAAARHRFCHGCNDVPLFFQIAVVANPTGHAAHD